MRWHCRERACTEPPSPPGSPLVPAGSPLRACTEPPSPPGRGLQEALEDYEQAAPLLL